MLSDVSVILFVFLILNSKFRNYPYSKYIYLFYVGLSILILYDFIFRENSAISILKSTRHFIFLVALNLDGLKESVVKKTFDLVINTGLVITVIYLMAVLFNISLLPFELEYMGQGLFNIRPSYAPVFLTLYIILLIPKKNSLKKIFLIFIFSLALLVSSSLGSIISIFVVVLIYTFIKYRFLFQRYLIITFSVLMSLLLVDIVSDYFNEKGGKA